MAAIHEYCPDCGRLLLAAPVFPCATCEHWIADPVPLWLARQLIDRAGGFHLASMLTHCAQRSIERQYSGAAQMPWTVAYVLSLNVPGALCDSSSH